MPDLTAARAAVTRAQHNRQLLGWALRDAQFAAARGDADAAGRELARAQAVLDEMHDQVTEAWAAAAGVPVTRTAKPPAAPRTYEQGRADERDEQVSKRNREMGLVFEDMRALLRALGMFDGARPESPHEVMTACIERAGQLAAQAAAATEADRG